MPGIIQSAPGSTTPNPVTAGSFQAFLNEIGRLGLDVARAKLIDVERVGDDANIPDEADRRYGTRARQALGGLTLGGVLLLVGVLVGGVWLVARIAK